MIVFFVASARCFCECGYALEVPDVLGMERYVFTDLIESDFLHLGDVHDNTDWIIQSYNVSAEKDRGPFG